MGGFMNNIIFAVLVLAGVVVPGMGWADGVADAATDASFAQSLSAARGDFNALREKGRTEKLRRLHAKIVSLGLKVETAAGDFGRINSWYAEIGEEAARMLQEGRPFEGEWLAKLDEVQSDFFELREEVDRLLIETEGLEHEVLPAVSLELVADRLAETAFGITQMADMFYDGAVEYEAVISKLLKANAAQTIKEDASAAKSQSKSIKKLALNIFARVSGRP